LQVTDLNSMEVDFLFRLQFDLNVSENEMEFALQDLLRERVSRKRARETTLESFRCRVRLHNFLDMATFRTQEQV
jgi:hypothetical protein